MFSPFECRLSSTWSHENKLGRTINGGLVLRNRRRQARPDPAREAGTARDHASNRPADARVVGRHADLGPGGLATVLTSAEATGRRRCAQLVASDGAAERAR